MADDSGIKLSEFPCPVGGTCNYGCDSTTGCRREQIIKDQRKAWTEETIILRRRHR